MTVRLASYAHKSTAAAGKYYDNLQEAKTIAGSSLNSTWLVKLLKAPFFRALQALTLRRSCALGGTTAVA